MKAKKIILISMSLVFPLIGFSKLSILNEQNDNPIKLDSIAGFQFNPDHLDYSKYIGQKLLFCERNHNWVKNKNTTSLLYFDTLINYLHNKKAQKVIKSGKSTIENSPEYKRLKYKYNTENEVIQSEEYQMLTKQIESINTINTDIYNPIFKYENSSLIGENIGSISSDERSLQGMFFTIISIKKHGHKGLEIELIKDSSNDTLYYRSNENDPTIINHQLDGDPFYPFWKFEKFKELFYKKDLVAIEDIVENKIHYGDNLKCINIIFTDYDASSFRKKPYCVLIQEGEEASPIYVEFNKMISSFVYRNEFIEMEKERLAEEKEEKERQKKQSLDSQRKEKEYYAECVKKFGLKYGKLIAKHEVILGMTREMCKASWGKPSDINTTILKGSTQEQWVYSLKRYLYFTNGVLDAIQK